MPRYPFAWRYTSREIRRRPGRSLLTLVGIVLGVAAAAAVSLGASATRNAYPGMFTLLAGRTALELRAEGDTGFVPDLAKINNMPGVSVSVPVIQAPAGLITATGPVPVMILGIDPALDSKVRDYRVLSGADLGEGDGLWLPVAFATRHGLKVGDVARLMTARGPVELPIAGLLAPEGPARFNNGAIAVSPLPQAQKLLGLTGRVNAVNIVLTPNTNIDTVRKHLSEEFPQLTVGRPVERGTLAGEFLTNLEQPLSALGAIAVISGALVILNTFLMHLTERRRQLALLRALGATRGQVLGLLLRQALLLGGLGTLLGIPTGIALTWLLLRLYENFLGIPMPQLGLSWTALLPAALLGPTITLSAVLFPASRAVRREPLPDLRSQGEAVGEPLPALPTILGASLVALVILFEVAIVFAWLPGPIAGRLLPVVVGFGLIGCACLLPLVQQPLLRLAGMILVPVLGVEGRLAVRHLLRRRARTGLTVGVLFAAMTACISFGVSLQNNTRDINLWYRHTIDVDFIVRTVQPDPAVILTPAPLPTGTIKTVGALSEVTAVRRLRFVRLETGDVPLLILARDFDREQLPLIIHEGDRDSLPRQLREGQLVLGTAAAKRLKVGVGASVTLPTKTGPRPFIVAALVKEYAVAGMAGYMDFQQAGEQFGFAEPHALIVLARAGKYEALQGSLRQLVKQEGLWLQSNADFEGGIDRVVVGVRWLLAALLVLILMVATAGVVNTLRTNVMDQTRELGVLRALGMKRTQILKLVLAQAMSLALVACLAGGPAGLLLAWLMNQATPGLQGHHVAFHFNWGYVAACLVAVVLLAVLAALMPARRAARLAIIDAVRFE